MTQFTYYWWRKELEKENDRLRKAVSDLTIEKLILKEVASGNY